MLQTAPPAVQLQEITKRFNGEALPIYDRFSLSIEPGESVAMVGPSGCGKTTLLNTIALLEGIDAGQIIIDGTVQTTANVGNPKLAYIFQRDALLPWETVLNNILIGAQCRSVSKRAIVDRAHVYMKRVGLDGLASRYPHTLSGGQKQLVALVQNLLIEPDLLLLDEPFAHLDFQSKISLETELLDIIALARSNRKRPMTLIMVTHDIEEAIVVATRLLTVGRLGNGPMKITRDTRIEITDEERDPIKLRESEALRRIFRETWDAIGALSGPIHRPQDEK